MLINLVKKSVEKDGKKFINFYLVNPEARITIPIEVKKFIKDGNLTISSKQAWNDANRLADWMTGSDSHKYVEATEEVKPSKTHK